MSGTRLYLILFFAFLCAACRQPPAPALSGAWLEEQTAERWLYEFYSDGRGRLRPTSGDLTDYAHTPFTYEIRSADTLTLTVAGNTPITVTFSLPTATQLRFAPQVIGVPPLELTTIGPCSDPAVCLPGRWLRFWPDQRWTIYEFYPDQTGVIYAPEQAQTVHFRYTVTDEALTLRVDGQPPQQLTAVLPHAYTLQLTAADPQGSFDLQRVSMP